MLKQLLLTLLVLTTSLTIQANTILLDEVDISGYTFRVPQAHIINYDIDNPQLALFFDANGFLVKNEDETVRVKPENIHATLRNNEFKNIIKYSLFYKFKVTQNKDGDYIVSPFIEVKGGGIAGANVGFFAGKFIVHFVAHSAIAVISVATGPAAGPTALSLEATFMPWIESTSNIVGCGTAILLGTATGPV